MMVLYFFINDLTLVIELRSLPQCSNIIKYLSLLKMKINKKVKLKDLGLRDYKDTWNYQTSLLDSIIQIKRKNRLEKKGILSPNYLLFVEHPHVYTLGKSGNLKHLLINNQQLKEKEATYYKINRGGDITYHGPGQIVGYPILDLENFFTDIHKYLRFLEEVIIRTVAEYGITAQRSKGETGVWIDVGTPFARKICAMGIRSSRWVTMHGFALNVTTDLEYFSHIVPCGIKGKSVTSLGIELGREIALSQVKEKILVHFKELFEVEEFV